VERDAAFVAYVAQRRPHLYRSAWLLCGDPHRAEDVVQETLTKLYLAWRHVSRADRVDAYVRRMLVNANIDESRKTWYRERTTAEPPDTPATPDSGEDDDELWTALQALPAGQRRVVVLRHYWGLTVEETASDLGVSAGTIKSQTSAALSSLRRVLAPEHPTPRAFIASDIQGDGQ